MSTAYTNILVVTLRPGVPVDLSRWAAFAFDALLPHDGTKAGRMAAWGTAKSPWYVEADETCGTADVAVLTFCTEDTPPHATARRVLADDLIARYAKALVWMGVDGDGGTSVLLAYTTRTQGGV